MLVVEFSVSTLDQGQSIAESVAKAVDIIDHSGLSYEVGSMGTTIEGDWDEVMKTVKLCVQEVSSDSNRIMFSIRGDLRTGQEERIEKNVERVEETLGRDLNT